VITERLLRIALLGSAWVLYLLLALSVLSISVMVERWLAFRRRRDDIGKLRKGVVNAILDRDVKKADALLAASPSIEAAVVRVGLEYRAGGTDAVTEAIESELERRKKELEKGANLLGTLGNNAPFVGLLGTVLGVIEAFHHLGDAQNKAAMGNVMAAIAEALVATGVGLFVAIPAVVAYNVLQEKISATEASVVSFRKIVLASLHLLDAPDGGEATASSGKGGKPAKNKARSAARRDDDAAEGELLHRSGEGGEAVSAVSVAEQG
jgi:biopolymer transport protein ExbB/TolQ